MNGSKLRELLIIEEGRIADSARTATDRDAALHEVFAAAVGAARASNQAPPFL